MDSTRITTMLSRQYWGSQITTSTHSDFQNTHFLYTVSTRSWWKINERTCLLRYVPSAKLWLLIQRDPFIGLDHMVQGWLDITDISFNRVYYGGEAWWFVIVSSHRQKIYWSSNTNWAGSRKDERCRLDLILAITNPGDFQVGTVIESMNTTLESTSDLLKSRSKR